MIIPETPLVSNVMTGVVVGLATVPVSPFAVATATLSTVAAEVPQVGQETLLPVTTMGAEPVMIPLDGAHPTHADPDQHHVATPFDGKYVVCAWAE